jgi:glycosyltransferase involved in cell wall biosynthesis
MATVDVTVAICTWKRADLLEQTLTGLAQMAVPAGLTWEVLIVNNNSPDHTDAVVARHVQAGRLPIVALHETSQGLSHARNCALRHACGQWILWTDDDVLVEPDWLSAFVTATQRHPDAVALGGKVEPWFPTPPDADLLAAFPALANGFCGVDHGPIERPLLAHEKIFGANMAYRRSATQELRFDPHLGRSGTKQAGGEDVSFLHQARATGLPVMWVPTLRLRHYVEPTRMTLDYARRLNIDTYHQAPLRWDAAPQWAGVPRWLLKQWLLTRVRSWWHALCGQRRARFAALIEHWQCTGLIAAYRAG